MFGSGADALILFLYLCGVLVIAWRAALRRRRGSEDYILAGRSLTMPTFVATLVTSFYGGTLGVGESAYRYGLSNWLMQGVPYYVFSALYAFFLAGRIRARKGLTIPDHLELAYGKPAAVLAALLIFILATPADEVLMLGTLFHWVTGSPLAVCVGVVAAMAAALLAVGGLRAEAWTGRLEFLLMFGGFALILPFAYLAAGGLGALRGQLPPLHLSWTGGQSPGFILTWSFIALWTFVDPSFHQRVCAAKDAATARRGILWSILFWFCSDFMTTAAGLYARALLPDLEDPLTAYPALAQRLLPPVLRGLFFAGIASSTLASLGATSFIAAVSAAKDGLGRLAGLSEAGEEKWIRRALVLTCVLSAGMALALPSVVALWFTVGSLTIPGLLVPLVTSYFEALRVGPTAGFLCSLSGWLAALGAWALGSGAPFYPGLGASLAVWGAARLMKPRSSPHISHPKT